MNKEITKSNKKQLNLLSFKMAQLNRQFDLMKCSIERCKREFPDCFHHKKKMQTECMEITKALDSGRYFVKQAIKSQILTKEQSQAIKEFLQAVSYLSFKFSDVANYIDQVENKVADDE